MQNARRSFLRVAGQCPPLVAPFPASTVPLNSFAAIIPCTPNITVDVYTAPTVTAWAQSFATASASIPTGVGSVSSHGSVSDSHAAVQPNANPVLLRYSELLKNGSLQKDDQQLALVQQLARLYDDICAYKAKMDEHHRATAEHQARRLKRLQELLAEEEAAEEERRRREAETARRRGGVGSAAGTTGPAAGSSGSLLSGLGSWFQSALASVSGAQVQGAASEGASARGGGGGGGDGDTPLGRARQAATRREERLDREVGPPPQAPEPPKGIYVWGSVGSGKSMLVALFYQVLVETAQLPATRWMHFNAAMLEVHSRLHHLDTERWRQRHERERLHQLHHHHQQQDQKQHQPQQQQLQIPQTSHEPVPTSQAQGPQPQVMSVAAEGLGTQDDRRAEERDREDDDDEEDVEEEDAAVAASAPGSGTAGDDLPVPEHLQGVFRHWDPRQDPEVQRQREAKAAMLAVRRHMRLARLGRHDPRTLAAANAQGLVRAAASFIRGRSGDPRSGWGAGSGPIASVLYFDEVQVTDVFSAVALKGLVEALTSAGCVLMCTSNRAPRELPRHGLHEDMWEHFVETLLQRCAVHELSSAADYRRVLLEQGRANIAATAATGGGGGASSVWPPLARSYILPAGPDGTAELERLWRARAGAESRSGLAPGGGLGGGSGGSAAAAAVPTELRVSDADQQQELQSVTVPVLFGRSLAVRRSSRCGGAAWFSFSELCAQPLGPADYVALSQRFHTVFLEGIPAMSMQVRDQARRFITLVDELYNARCLLVASAEVAPEELFAGAEGQEPILDLEGLQFETAVEGARLRRDVMTGGGVAPVAASPAALAAAMGALGGEEERFAFRRAVSRLLEMQSPQYILSALRMRQQPQGQQRQQQQ